MYFLQAVSAPVVVSVGDVRYSIPRMTLGDHIAWCAEIEAERVSKATEGLDASQRAQYLTMYPMQSLDISQLKAIVRSPEGAKRVVRTCLAKASPPMKPDLIEQSIQASGAGRLAALAWILADLNENDIFVQSGPKQDDDPLASTGQAE